MSRTKDERYLFGPSLEDTLEVGDILHNHRDDRLLRIIDKRYRDDMSISYLMEPLNHGRMTEIVESTLLRPGGGGFERIYKIPRTIIQTEKTFTGVFYGTS